ncbi:hypothetical protein KFL_005280050 [Klebsormidium nitens]|uniref:Uncharacterized protein n=1 Tax=Klebsormidium nitens TaxID=105231 RepID=A0A1Y1IF02_KLENI|nr:hypothetical protein KFL_005280050 [Klebsormidium nitens]|eukprot:GAQ89485.1 hypothetical protein KFL_005280050 [Klebsormidium nitens]
MERNALGRLRGSQNAPPTWLSTRTRLAFLARAQRASCSEASFSWLCKRHVATLFLCNQRTLHPEYAPLVGLAETPEPEPFKGPTDELQNGIQFLHVGREIRVGQIEDGDLADLGGLAESIGFTADVTRWSVHEFRAAQVGGEGFQTQEHQATKARHSFNVQARVPIGKGGQAKAAYATILRFLRLSDDVTGEQLRLVKLTVYGQPKQERGLEVIDASQPLLAGKFFDASCLLTKFIFAKEKGNESRTFVLPCHSRGL